MIDKDAQDPHQDPHDDGSSVGSQRSSSSIESRPLRTSRSKSKSTSQSSRHRSPLSERNHHSHENLRTSKQQRRLNDSQDEMAGTRRSTAAALASKQANEKSNARSTAQSQQDKDLRKKLKALEKEKEDQEKENQAKEAKYAALEAKYKAMKAQRKRGALPDGDIPPVPKNDAILKLIVDGVTRHLWRDCKFIGTTQQVVHALQLILRNSTEWRKFEKLEKAARFAKLRGFTSTYGDHITHTLNEKRSSVQSGIKNVYMEREKAGLPVPTAEQFLHIVLRQDLELLEVPKLSDEEKKDEDKVKEVADIKTKNVQIKVNQEWFFWYHDKILAKVGGRPFWPESVRYYNTISEATFPEDDSKHYMTPSSEAFAVLCFENNKTKWPYEAKGGEDPKNQAMETEYTCSKSGKNKFGGWNNAARKQLVELVKLISEARADPKSETAEKMALERVQKKYRIKEKEAKKKAKKKPKRPRETEVVEIPFDEEMEEEDEEEGEFSDGEDEIVEDDED